MSDVVVNLRAHIAEVNAELAAARGAAHRLRAELARMDATWEPHDWSDFQ